MNCQVCGEMLQPFGILEVFVEIHEPITGLDEKDAPVGYEPTGYTDAIWDTQQDLGYGCTHCGTVEITRKRIKIANEWFFVHSADDRFGRNA